MNIFLRLLAQFAVSTTVSILKLHGLESSPGEARIIYSVSPVESDRLFHLLESVFLTEPVRRLVEETEANKYRERQ